jgi:P2 family phage contractile tail tube protein
MGKISYNRLTNANVYVSGNSLLGQAEEVNLPDLKHKLSEHKALGMIGTTELWAGIDKMEATIKWNSFYKDTLVLFADPTQALQLQIRSSLETYGSTGRTEQKPVVCFITGMPKNFPMGNFKQHDNVEATSQLTIIYMKVEIDRQEIIEVDLMANIFRVNGVDIMAQYRANIGS